MSHDSSASGDARTEQARRWQLHTAYLDLLGEYLRYRTGAEVVIGPTHPLLREPLYALLDWSTARVRTAEAAPPPLPPEPKADDHLRVGDTVWWLRMDKKHNRSRPGLPVAAVVMEQTATRVKIRTEEQPPADTWVPHTRLRRRPQTTTTP